MVRAKNVASVVRVAVVLTGSVLLFGMSACVTASKPERVHPLQGAPISSYTSSNSPLARPSAAKRGASGPTDLGSASAVPPGYSEDPSQSSALTSYLDKSRLPLVGAQVFRNRSGNRQVILHGFVATDFGKQDAATKSRRYLNEPGLPVINRIVVHPELLASGGSGAGASSSPSALAPDDSFSSEGLGDLESYQSQTQQAQNQQTQSDFRTMILLMQIMSLFF